MTTEQSTGRTRFASCAADRILLAAQALAVADRLTTEFGSGATARDRDRTLPYLEIDRLATSTFPEDGVIDRYSDRWRSVAEALATSSKAANHA
ncbi:hypothetical protein AB0C34_09905 [Nocardia sp. NPDC049220]|uniref:hypothetical protein n=1 Tax=Nocardia sp. NPDC049220 TaxID=3155273 RepID=UPI0033DFC8AA